MKLDDLRRNWTEFGEKDPYWAILTDPRSKDGGWDLDEFFASGRGDIDATLHRLGELGQPTSGDRCLDFGCGVGRLTRALAAHYTEAVGVDIASTMIARAGELNQDTPGATFIVNERDDLSIFEDESFDLIYTVIVLQHMRPEYSTRYLREFMRILRPGGSAVFQIPIAPLTAEELAAQRLAPEAYRARFTAGPIPPLKAGETFPLTVRVENAGSITWPALPPDMPPLRVGNHWCNAAGGVVVQDDGRSYLPRDLAPGDSLDVELLITAPRHHGVTSLRLDMVHENIGWFAGYGSTTVDVPVTVQVGWRPRFPAGKARRFLSRARRYANRRIHRGPVMEMYSVPEDQIRAIVAEGGGRVLAADKNWNCSYPWHSRTFFVTR